MTGIFQTLFSGDFPRRHVLFALETLYYGDPETFTRQGEDLCLVLADRRFRPFLASVFPGITGPRRIDFTPSPAISRGDPKSLLEPVTALVANEFQSGACSVSDILDIVDRILRSAEFLSEHGSGTPDIPDSPYRTENERRATLNAIIGAGNNRVTIDPQSLPLTADLSVVTPGDAALAGLPEDSFSSSPRSSLNMRFFEALRDGGTVFDAAVSMGIMNSNLLTVARGIKTLSRRLSQKNHPEDGGNTPRSGKTRIRRTPPGASSPRRTR